jgi:lysyl-tRNA synthetase class I
MTNLICSSCGRSNNWQIKMISDQCGHIELSFVCQCGYELGMEQALRWKVSSRPPAVGGK